LTDTVLVTGGGGQVARALSKNQSHFRVVSCTRSELDISKEAVITEYLERVKPNLVVNTAAYTAVDAAEDDLESAGTANCVGPTVLSKACADRGIPLIHLSTDYVFDGLSEQPYSESGKPCPSSAYGRTKFEGEEAVRSNLPEHIILRLSGIFSTHGNCFPRAIIKAALRNPELKVIDDQVTGPTSAKSVATVIGEIASKVISGRLHWGTYHFAQQPFVSWYQFATVILERAQEFDERFRSVKVIPVSTASYGARAVRPKNSCLDSRKLLATFDLAAGILDRDDDLDAAILAIVSDL
jgi:dTDP-4-dehydrorhamnose reductase